MLAQIQRLTGWRLVWPLLHHHHHHHHHLIHRLLTSSAARRTDAKRTVKPWDSFGCLAASGHERFGDQVSVTAREKLSRSSKRFPEPTQGFPEPHKGSSGLSQHNVLDKWHQFKDAEYQEALVEWGRGDHDDVAEQLAPRGTPSSLSQGVLPWKASRRRDAPQETAERPSEDAVGVCGGGGQPHKPPEAGELFGSLSPQVQEAEGDEGDLREEHYQEAKLQRRHRPHYYAIKMKRLCHERKLSEALLVLEEEMPAAGTKPDNFCYQVLINSCGRAGYTRKAFQLYNQMKKRGLKVEPVTYTGLFTACARSPWPTRDGLERATHLRSQLRDKGYQFNQTVSHAMIMAFGRCGDMRTAFLVVDEMIRDGVLVTTETINFLLQACVTDKKTGFRHAVKVWRRMRALRLKPDIYSYNLLMRILKECGAGDPSHTSSLLKDDDDPSHTLLKDNNDPSHTLLKNDANPSHTLLKGDNSAPGQPSAFPHSHKRSVNSGLPDFDEASQDPQQDSRNATGGSVVHAGWGREAASHGSGQDVLPNILARKMTVGQVVALGALDEPQDRLALLGGPAGIMRQMVMDRVTPDLKTVTQLMESLPPDTHAEQALLESMENLGLEPDTQFFNMLIKRRNYRHDIRAAQEVMALFQEHHLTPDLVTFGCLAMGCRTTRAATRFLKDMDAARFRPNLQIMTILVKNSLVKHDYGFTVAMLTEMQHRRTTPDHFLLDLLEQARSRARNTLMGKDGSGKKGGRSRGPAGSSVHQQDSSRVSAETFLAAYKAWLKGSDVQLPEHPWTQYKEHQAHPTESIIT